jgi:chromosome partitioning protein
MVIRSIGFVNRKGGVGKTTSVVNIAAELSARGNRVLCIDCDPQATLTLLAGAQPEQIPKASSVLAALLPEAFGEDAARHLSRPAPWGGELWPACPDLAGAETALGTEAAGPNRRLARALAGHDYDYVLIDCPPSVGRLAMNAMAASQGLLVPVLPNYASVGGLKRLLSTVALLREYEQPELQVLGVFFTMARGTVHERETREALSAQLPELVMRSEIPLAVSVQDAQAAHQALGDYDPAGRAGRAYTELCAELLERISRSVPAPMAAAA